MLRFKNISAMYSLLLNILCLDLSVGVYYWGFNNEFYSFTMLPLNSITLRYQNAERVNRLGVQTTVKTHSFGKI